MTKIENFTTEKFKNFTIEKNNGFFYEFQATLYNGLCNFTTSWSSPHPSLPCGIVLFLWIYIWSDSRIQGKYCGNLFYYASKSPLILTLVLTKSNKITELQHLVHYRYTETHTSSYRRESWWKWEPNYVKTHKNLRNKIFCFQMLLRFICIVYSLPRAIRRKYSTLKNMICLFLCDSPTNLEPDPIRIRTETLI